MKIDRTEVKIAVVGVHEKSRSILYRYTGPLGRFLYRIANPVFDREKNAVHRGDRSPLSRRGA